MMQSVFSILTGPFADSVAIFHDASVGMKFISDKMNGSHEVIQKKSERVLVEYGPFGPSFMIYKPFFDADDGSECVRIKCAGINDEGFVMTIGEFLVAMTEVGAEETKCEVMRIFDSMT